VRPPNAKSRFQLSFRRTPMSKEPRYLAMIERMNAALRINPVTARICELSGPSNLILLPLSKLSRGLDNSTPRDKLND